MRLPSILVALVIAAPTMADEIWVTNEKDDTVSVIDVETLEVVQTYPTGERPRGITFSKAPIGTIARGLPLVLVLKANFLPLANWDKYMPFTEYRLAPADAHPINGRLLPSSSTDTCKS